MADFISEIFSNRKVKLERFEPFGFEREGDSFVLNKTLDESGFLMRVEINGQGEVSALVFDPDFKEAYTLHLAEGAAGSFVGGIREEYKQVLSSVAEGCFEPDVFKEKQSKEVIEYVRKTCGDELEFLWKKFPSNAVWRRKDNAKWYGVLLTVSRRKLGLNSDESCEIIDLRTDPHELQALIDNEMYFPGYHMNKKHWLTIILDGRVSSEEVFNRIDISFQLAKK